MMAARGFSLMVVLVFLVLLGMLGFTLVQATIMQEKISSNLHEKQLSFLAAEAALREGHMYLATADSLPQPAQPLERPVAGRASQGAHVARYRISCIDDCQPSASGRVYYRILAKGFGMRATTVSELEMVVSIEDE